MQVEKRERDKLAVALLEKQEFDLLLEYPRQCAPFKPALGLTQWNRWLAHHIERQRQQQLSQQAQIASAALGPDAPPPGQAGMRAALRSAPVPLPRREHAAPHAPSGPLSMPGHPGPAALDAATAARRPFSTSALQQGGGYPGPALATDPGTATHVRQMARHPDSMHHRATSLSSSACLMCLRFRSARSCSLIHGRTMSASFL